tara:strand:+ start:957 stop:1340 length:384 start_codon:yes stop_codon:yes gene_type:complete
MSEKIADFQLHHVNTTYEHTGGKTLRASVNWKSEGEMDHYGAGFGTLILEHDMENPNAESGACTWQGEGFRPDGERGMGHHSGTWETKGTNTWSVRMEGWDSFDGDVVIEGEISLAELTFSGSTYRK